MAAIGALPSDALDGHVVLGELALDGTLTPVAGVLPAAVAANMRGLGLICPAQCGPEAAWASRDMDVVAPRSLIQLANHLRGTQVLSRPQPAVRRQAGDLPDLRDVKGQESAKRALEIAAAGGHNLLMNGPPGAGKSMLAARLPSILPPLSPRELLEVSMIHSVAGEIAGGELTDRRPFRAPHHSASMPALVGGGAQARPGEISLAHNGVLFLDELPEFQSQALDALRQPLETGEVAIARANHRAVYPARFQLVAAMNPCRCGHARTPGFACKRQPNERCAAQYQARLSGPLLDRFDLQIEVAAISAADLVLPPPSGRLGGSRGARRGGARNAARALRGARTRRARDERRRARQSDRNRRQARFQGNGAHPRGLGALRAFGARLPSRPEARAHDRRSRRAPIPSRAAISPRRSPTAPASSACSARRERRAHEASDVRFSSAAAQGTILKRLGASLDRRSSCMLGTVV